MSEMDTIDDILSLTLFSISGKPTTVGSLLLITLIIAFTFILARLIGKLVYAFTERRKGPNSVLSEAYEAVAKFLVWFVGLIIVLQLLRIELTTLFAASSILAIGAGFAARNIVENLFYGSILQAEKIIRPGDLIVASDDWLIVQRASPLNIIAHTFDGAEVIIPNSKILQSTVRNLTRNNRLYRISLKVGVAYESDLALVRKTLEETVNKLEWRSKENNPFVWLSEFSDSSVVYKVFVWIDDAIYTGERRSNLHEAIWWALKDAGIAIAFPQLDVHLDRSSVETTSE